LKIAVFDYGFFTIHNCKVPFNVSCF